MSEQEPRPKYIDFTKARSQEQLAKYLEIEKAEICPFCPEYFDEHTSSEPVEISEHWTAFENMTPYENTEVHLILVNKRHVEHISEMLPEEWEDLGNISDELSRDWGFGGLACRFGDFMQTAASVSHMHFHLIKPKDDLPEGEKVKFKISR